MRSRQEMEQIVGMSRSDAYRDEYPPPRCPKCGSSDIEIDKEEKGDHGFTMHAAQGVCNKCGTVWRT